MHPLGDDADLCDAVLKANEILMYFVDEVDSAEFNNDKFNIWTLYHGTPPKIIIFLLYNYITKIKQTLWPSARPHQLSSNWFLV